MTQTTQGNFKKKLLALAVLAPAMAITACSNDGAYIPGEEAGEKAGVAYDGYLRGATVCADVDLNKACDANEPTTTSIEGGFYLLTGLSASQQKYPLALQAKKGVTIDEDTGEAITDDFTYVAPAGAKTISAFSTIVQVETERRIAAGETPAAAEQAAKAKLSADLGIPADIDLTNFDAVAVSQSSNINADVALQMRVLNQVVTKQLVKAAGTSTGASSAVIYAAVQKVNTQLQNTKALVETALEGETAADIDPETISTIAAATSVVATETITQVSDTEVSEAAGVVAAAQETIKETIAEETQEEQEPAEEPGTGATGGSDGGTQGAA